MGGVVLEPGVYRNLVSSFRRSKTLFDAFHLAPVGNEIQA